MGIIGLLSVQGPLGYISSITAGLLRALEPQGIALCSSYTSIPHPIQSLPPWRIDGAVVVSSLSLEEVMPVERARIPYVAINGVGGPHAKLVSMDDEGGARLALEHLLSLGHRKIAYANVGGPYQQHVSVDIRHKTYLRVIAETGLSPMPLHDQPVPEPPDEFLRTVVLRHGATAIVAYHAYQAVLLLQTMLRMNIAVPRQVSLVSLGGGFPLDKLCPAVTAVELPFDQAGELAGQMLLNAGRARPRPEPREVVLSEKLIIRESTAPPEHAEDNPLHRSRKSEKADPV